MTVAMPGGHPVYSRSGADEDAEAGRADWWPLSFSQEATLLADEWARYVGAPPVHTHFPVAVRINGRLELEALSRALNAVLRSHPGLTAAFHPTAQYGDSHRRLMLDVFGRTRRFVPGAWGQWFYRDVQLRVRHRTLAPMVREVDETLLAELAQEEAFEPLTLDVPPAMRAAVISCNPTTHLLVLTVTHLTVDGWSAGILRNELRRLYDSIVSGHAVALGATTAHAGTVAVDEHRRLRSGGLDYDVQFWMERTGKNAAAMLRHDELACAACTGQRHHDRTRAMVRSVDASYSTRIRAQLTRHRVTPYVLFRLALTIVLQRYAGRSLIAFSANFANRSRPGADQAIASCARAHVVGADVSAEKTVVEACRAITASLAEARLHEAASESLLPLFGVQTHNPHAVRLTFDSWPAARHADDEPMQPVVVPAGRRWVDLDVRFRDGRDSLIWHAAYNPNRRATDAVVRLLDQLADVTGVLATVDWWRTPVEAVADALRASS